ncbi:MAG: hypothetical protein ACK4K7_07565 [Allosphingosinicella sp.]|uniref:hypothetical protein n=1 Tax=Allosphingosinicella sp. TaxID=2823234 RepID=UPI00395E1024
MPIRATRTGWERFGQEARAPFACRCEPGEECGNDPEKVFPGRLDPTDPRPAYTDFQGYSELSRWRGERRDKAWLREITNTIHERRSPFRIGFLRRCIESTLFADLCATEVKKVGDTVPRYGRPWANEAVGFEHRVICTFLDGVAARRDVPLVDDDRFYSDD